MVSKTSEHLTEDALEAYVLGALDGIEATAVEHHVAACAACAVRLQREAALDVAFAAVVASTKSTRLPRVSHVSAVAGAALAMAAAMLLWVAPRSEHAQQSTDLPIGAMAPDQATVVEMGGDASTVTASLDLQADGSRVGVRD